MLPNLLELLVQLEIHTRFSMDVPTHARMYLSQFYWLQDLASS